MPEGAIKDYERRTGPPELDLDRRNGESARLRVAAEGKSTQRRSRQTATAILGAGGRFFTKGRRARRFLQSLATGVLGAFAAAPHRGALRQGACENGRRASEERNEKQGGPYSTAEECARFARHLHADYRTPDRFGFLLFVSAYRTSGAVPSSVFDQSAGARTCWDTSVSSPSNRFSNSPRE